MIFLVAAYELIAKGDSEYKYKAAGIYDPAKYFEFENKMSYKFTGMMEIHKNKQNQKPNISYLLAI